MIPLAKGPPILVAAVPQGSKSSAESLKDLHFELINLLHGVSIYPVSLSSDGTETECKLQWLINDSAQSHFFYGISNPAANCTVNLNIPLFHGHPSIIVQDSKHGLKTGWNQLFTGARMLVIGNYPCFYQQLLSFMTHPLGLLFSCDVERVDRQDDQASACLFSAEALVFYMSHYQSQVGLSVHILVYHWWASRCMAELQYLPQWWSLNGTPGLLLPHGLAKPCSCPSQPCTTYTYHIERVIWHIPEVVSQPPVAHCHLLQTLFHIHTHFCHGCTLSISLALCTCWRRTSISQTYSIWNQNFAHCY